MMKVLIADDEPISRQLLEILLSKWGYEVTVASSGEEAWRLLQAKEHPKIAILGSMARAPEGMELCQKVRQCRVPAPAYVLLLTSKQQEETMDGISSTGADDCLAKPFGARELQARLRVARRVIDLEEQLRSAQQALSVETTHDLLTGLWNRSTILEFLHRELHRSRRQKLSMALVLADLDRLQEINYTHGHLAGDAVLRETSRRMRNSIRIYDSMGRYGGGRLAIVSPSCDQAGALVQAERLRTLTNQCPVETSEGAVAVTVSLGVAVGNDEKQSHSLIADAESALVRAKKAGRDRVAAAVN